MCVVVGIPLFIVIFVVVVVVVVVVVSSSSHFLSGGRGVFGVYVCMLVFGLDRGL